MDDVTKIILGVVGIGIVCIVVFAAYMLFIGIPNTLVDKDVRVETAMGDLQSQYQRRADLIPSLVNVTMSYAKFESKTQTEVAMLRSQAATGQQMMKNAKTPAEIEEADTMLGNTLSRLMVVVEAYPDLKAIQEFTTLSAQIEGTENRINYARTEYNANVQEYKKYVRSFPGNLIANDKGYSEDKWEMFKASPGSETAPIVPMINL